MQLPTGLWTASLVVVVMLIRPDSQAAVAGAMAGCKECDAERHHEHNQDARDAVESSVALQNQGDTQDSDDRTPSLPDEEEDDEKKDMKDEDEKAWSNAETVEGYRRDEEAEEEEEEEEEENDEDAVEEDRNEKEENEEEEGKDEDEVEEDGNEEETEEEGEEEEREEKNKDEVEEGDGEEEAEEEERDEDTLRGPRSTGRLWPNATVPYVIRGSTPFRRRVLKVMSTVQKNTCVRFTRRRAGETRHVVIRDSGDGGCWTHPPGYPRKDTKVTVSLGPGCKKTKEITHEVLHALGLVHEHNRPDRDKYIRVNWGNMDRKNRVNFKINRRYTPLHLPYDRFSIMHYGKNYFAKDRRELTLELKQPDGGGLGGSRLSHLDKRRINTLYDCHLSPAPHNPRLPSPAARNGQSR